MKNPAALQVGEMCTVEDSYSGGPRTGVYWEGTAWPAADATGTHVVTKTWVRYWEGQTYRKCSALPIAQESERACQS